MGGTGKTPHTEMLVQMLLDENLHIATLSRGYKRRTRGFRIATPESTAADIGDEPLQLALRFPQITVAVDENRCHGIRQLLASGRQIDVVILDDAFQHRYVKPSLNILLVDYNRPICKDRLLPAGRLREHARGKCRADVVIVSKCPSRMTPFEQRVIRDNLQLMPFQRLFFTTMRYGDLQPLFVSEPNISLKSLSEADGVMLVCGIAVPERLQADLQPFCRHVSMLAFPDHHAFTSADVENINSTFNALPEGRRIIVTTAKDATRLRLVAAALSPVVAHSIYILPLSVNFLHDETKTFRQLITKHIKSKK